MDADSLRNKKVEVLKAIRRWTPKEAAQNAVLGQYRGYLEEKRVAPDSVTATYAALRLDVDNWRWQGVPFYLRSGKAMAEKVSEITIQFRSPPDMMFSQDSGPELTPNVLGICIQPDEGVHLKFEVNVPDQGMSRRSEDMAFHYESAFNRQNIPKRTSACYRTLWKGTHLFSSAATTSKRPGASSIPYWKPGKLRKHHRLTSTSQALGGPRPRTTSWPKMGAPGCEVVAAMGITVPDLHILPSPEDASHAAAEFVATLAERQISIQDRFTIALSGGSTPRSPLQSTGVSALH